MPDTIKRTTGTKVAFGDVVQLSKERSKDPEADGFERYIGLEHLESSDLKVRSWGDLADGVTFTNVFHTGQVLFGKRRAYQRKVAVADFSGVCSGDIYVLEPKGEQLLPELLPFICQSEPFYDYVISMSQGGLSPRVNWKALAKYEFALPPLEEQRRIAEVLQAVEKEKVALAVAKQRAQACLEATYEWKIGLHRKHDSRKQSKVYGEVPSDWDEVKLADCCELITDGEHNTPPRTESGVLLLSARNILNRELRFDDVDYVSEATFEELSKRVRPALGDVLISCSGTIGRVCEVPSGLDFALVRSVAIVRPNKSMIDHRFLAESLRSRYGQRQIKSLVGQTAQGNLFQGAIQRLVVPRLALARQVETADQCERISQGVLRYAERIDQLSEFNRSLLAKMLGGEE